MQYCEGCGCIIADGHNLCLYCKAEELKKEKIKQEQIKKELKKKEIKPL